MLVRLQKIIADRGYCSRRTAEDLIAQGQVSVDDKVVTELGSKFEEDTVVIKIGNNVLKPRVGSEFHYVLVNKPLGFLTALSDQRGRKTVDLLVPETYGRLFPVGRLDINTSGALIMTDDGDFANLVSHPSSSFPKTYEVTVNGLLSTAERNKIKTGIMLEDGMTSPAELRIINLTLDESTVAVTIHEGKNREIRRMMEALGHEVLELKRTAIGPIALGDLPRGAYREIPKDTVEQIRELCLKNKANNTFVKDGSPEENPSED
jgi:23S rRNA pseudouridine2605 synthase